MARRTLSDPAIGQRIRDRRNLLGYSIRFAADRANISHTTWSRIERGIISADNRFTLAAIAEALRCPIGDLTKAPDPSTRTEVETGRLVYEITRAALEADLAYEPDRPAKPITALLRELDLIHDLCSRCDYAATARRLPDLLRDLHAAASGPERETALHGLILAVDAAASTVRYLGDPASAYLVTERAQQAAEVLDDPVMLGVASFTRSNVTISCGLWARALIIAEHAAEELRPHLLRPGAPEVYGQLLLTQAFCHYAMGHLDQSESFITDARQLADRTGETKTFGLMFGPTNVNFWKIAMEADGDSPGRAVEIARNTYPQAIAQVSRQATYYLDTARALARVGKDREALRLLLTAERMAPQGIRTPLVIETTRDLLERARRSTGWTELRGLCERLGIGV